MKIVYLNGDDSGKSVELTPSGLTIGRETDNHLQLPVGGVSRYHARIEFMDGSYTLRDLGSTNGTKLNGIAIQKVETISANDVIGIGEQQFRVIDENAENGQKKERPSTNTVKIAVNVPVPEPAAPQFVFRPDAEAQPPPPPPGSVLDSNETATVQVTPDQVPGGSDFFAKRDVDGNIFKRDKEKKSGAKSSLRSNLVFILVLVAMLCGGALIAKKLFNSNDRALAENDNEKQYVTGAQNINNPFFFAFDKQEVEDGTGFICRKKFYCRRATDDECARNNWEKGTYLLEVTFDKLEKQQRTVYFQACVTPDMIADLGNHDSVENFLTDLQASPSTDTGSHTVWTRIVIGKGDKLNDVIYFDDAGRNFAVFSRMEEAIEDFISQLPDGDLMKPTKEILQEADHAFDSAEQLYLARDVDPSAYYKALVLYRDAARRYNSFTPPPDRYSIANERIVELDSYLKELKKSAIQRMQTAAKRRDLDTANQICTEAMRYFPDGSDEYAELRTKLLKIEELQRQRMKGK